MLSRAQIAARAGKLTASRVACLMTGDSAAILRLYQEMIGEAEPEDLRHIWPVRLGEATEQLQLDWYEERNNLPVIFRGEVMAHPSLPWAAATLDGWVRDLRCPIECKHVGGREPLEVVVERYQPQMQWQMEVTEADQCVLSVIMGASEPIVEFIERSSDYAAKMVERGAQFMRHVEARTPPVVLNPVAPPVDASVTYDMSLHERCVEWERYGRQWIQVKGAADTARECEKLLKSIVPADAKKCHGYGIQITRDRAGRLSLREAR